MVCRVKAVKIVDEQGRLAQPLAVDLAPACLGPAGIGDRQVQAVRVHAVPVTRCADRPGVLEAVRRDLGIARRAGRRSTSASGHRHEPGIPQVGDNGWNTLVLFVEVVPAFPFSVHNQLQFQARSASFAASSAWCAVSPSAVQMMALTPAALKAVFEVVFLQLSHRRDRDRADLLQTEDREQNW